MRNLSLQEKEQEILATLSAASSILFENVNNFKKLYESLDFVGNIESNNKLKLEDFRNNKYVYLQKVNEYLKKDCPEDILVNLNESQNIDLFKKELNDVIFSLSKNNDFNKFDIISPEILKTKLLAKQPIYVYGFDIVNNLHLQNELKDTYRLNIINCISIIFDKTNKQLMFVFEGSIIFYILNSDELKQEKWDIDKKNYLSIIKEEINANLVQLYINTNQLELKFTDNMFFDKRKTEEFKEKAIYKNNNMFVKTPINNN